MTITAALVLFAVIWFMTFFVVLPLNLTTQGDAGQVVPARRLLPRPGFVVKRKAVMTTWIALALWIVIAGVILSGAITVRDIDWFGRMGPAQG